MSTNKHTTNCIYRIVCFASGKVYVGKTVNPRRRRNSHFWHLRNNRHENIYLQREYNRYGDSSFYFEVIEKNIPDADLDEREIYWIQHFDSKRHGYNMTYGGDQATTTNGTTCVWNGIVYPSINAASRAIGIDKSAMARRLKKGYASDADIKHHFYLRKCTWNGISYPTVREAAIACGVNTATMIWRLDRGYQSDDDIPRANEKKPIEWNGIGYPSIKAAAEALGVTPSLMSTRLKSGYTSDNDLDLDYTRRAEKIRETLKPKRKITDEQIDYAVRRYSTGNVTLRELGNEMGFSPQYLHKIIKRHRSD